MKSVLLAFMVVLGVGCSKAQRDLEDIEKRACSCGTDAKCGEVLVTDLGAWLQKYKDDSVSNEDAITRSLTHTVECLTTAGVSASSIRSALGS